jgi:hypothetical protein
MAEPSSTWMTTREATLLADKLSGYGGKHSVATRIAIMEVQCRQASRLIRAMLRQVHASDVFRLPPEE